MKTLLKHAFFCGILLYAFLSTSGILYAQILYPINGDQHSSATGKLFNESFNSAKDSTAVPVAMTSFINGNVVNTAPLAQAFPSYSIPYLLIPVSLPDLSAYTDTVAVVWFLRNPLRPSVGVINIMLIAQAQDQQHTYFIDSNNNGDFTDDEEGFQFKPGELQREIEVRDNRIGAVKILLRDLVGDEDSEYEDSEGKQSPVAEGSLENRRNNRRLQLHVIGGLSSGSGDASMYFKVVPDLASDERNKSYNYTAKYFASLNTEIGLALSFRNFMIGGSASYEFAQVGEQNLTLTYEKKGTPVRQFLNNQGSWPYARVNLSVFTEYDIPVTDKLSFSPLVSYTRYYISTEKPFQHKGDEKLNNYFLDRFAFSYGGKIKYKVDKRVSIFAQLYKRENHFDASSYFSGLEEGSYNLKFNQVYGGVGAQVRVSKF